MLDDNLSQLEQELELIPETAKEINANQRLFLSWFSNIWHLLTDAFIYKSKIQVLQCCDRDGNLCWYVYDPITHQFAWLESEDEIRVWIEQLYRR